MGLALIALGLMTLAVGSSAECCNSYFGGVADSSDCSGGYFDHPCLFSLDWSSSSRTCKCLGSSSNFVS